MASIIDIIKFVTNEEERSEFVAKFLRVWKPWELSKKGFDFLAEWESGTLNGLSFNRQTVIDGFILQVHLDSRKIPTVGCGHRVWPQDKLPPVGQSITMQKAVELFEADKKLIIKKLESIIAVPLFQYEFDAIVSVLFNTGIYRGRAEELVKELNKGRYDKMPEVIEGFLAKTNPKRRKSEARLFETGVHDATH